ncbi:YfcL family protein [Oceanimonas sp. CHS3-5]|uniref:YfcL family protein n=1 Tax=Oceanimonas sp. CHS3-5 TaxID=3068186 RepID=UPI00273EBA47|nr:YfcL family protein [Oceanimonas sp. CHS3-5]MDP5291239.1 YfcL family protein [Oceanimonas sp. CHS3-5]
MNIFEFEQRLLNEIDGKVAEATNDQLFAGGYLRGHITLAVAQSEIAGRNHVRDVKARVKTSLNQAILSGELNDDDQKLVLGYWNQLLEKAEADAI